MQEGLAKTVNKFCKIDHTHPEFLSNLAIAVLPIDNTYNPQELSNTTNAFEIFVLNTYN